MTVLRAAFLLFFSLCLPAMARADCSALLNPPDAALQGHSANEIQRGLRSIFQDQNGLLRDGRLGNYTLRSLERLCTQFFPIADDVAAQTIDLASEFGRLDRFTAPGPDWVETLHSDDLAGRLNDPQTPKDEALPLRLAASALMTAKALGDLNTPFYCRAAQSAVQDDEAARRVLRKLYGRFRMASPSAICQLLPIAGSGEDFAAALVRLDAVEQALPGALDDLMQPDFARWLASASDMTRLRLVGTTDTSVEVIRAFRARVIPQPLPPTDNPCAVQVEDRSTTFFAFGQSDLEKAQTSFDITPLLDAFAEANPALDSAASLWNKLEEVLKGKVDDCILPSIRAKVLGDDDLGLSFRLDPDAANTLMVEPELQAVLPVIKEYLDAVAPTEEQLLTGIRAALQVEVSTVATTEIETAAGILAAAAEPVAPLQDTAAITAEIPEEDAPPPITGVTDATALTLEQSISNKAFVDVLLASDFTPATKPELLKGEVRSILRPVAEEQSRQKVDFALDRITPTTRAGWSITAELRTAILGIPYIAEAGKAMDADALAQRLKDVVGVQVPTERLFRAALAASGGEPPAPPLPETIADKLTAIALKKVDQPDARRLMTSFAKPDCSCVPFPEKKPEIYGFYPFWFAPTLKEVDASEDPVLPKQIDFSLLGRVAFYGLEFDFADPDVDPSVRDLTLRHEKQWAAAKRDFVNAAHRHRARVDVSFDLRNWVDWTDRNITQAVAGIATQMAPFEKLPSYDIADLRAALPTIFDRPQPDGLTLIFNDYASTGTAGPAADQMIKIITAVYESLPDRDELDINVAFDFGPIADHLDKGVFDELYDLLVTRAIIVQEPETDADGLPKPGTVKNTKRDTVQMVKRILLFLERRTSDSKKGLRYRMEQGLFQGKDRAKVLRSILPVIPPGGHEFVKPSNKTKRRADLPKTFGQFSDDVIYFKDNFAGLGFWPLPELDGPETPEVTRIVRAQFDNTALPAFLKSFEDDFDNMCTRACPNRAYIALIGMVLFALSALLTWRSFYNGRVDKIAFRILIFGGVGLLNAAVFVILLVLTGCDTGAVMAPNLLYAFIAVMAIITIGNLLNRALNGPKP